MRGLSIYIDRITHRIEDASTLESVETDIIALHEMDLKAILKKAGWRFNWRKEFNTPGRQLYKLVVKGGSIIEGLISLRLFEAHIEMELIETAPHNFGRSKKWVGVPGNLVAFACKMSFDSGLEGFVGFEAKTRLIQHYIDKFGAALIYISGNSAKKLVNSYYKDYFHDW